MYQLLDGHTHEQGDLANSRQLLDNLGLANSSALSRSDLQTGNNMTNLLDRSCVY